MKVMFPIDWFITRKLVVAGGTVYTRVYYIVSKGLTIVACSNVAIIET